jgi:hypothetical protein
LNSVYPAATKTLFKFFELFLEKAFERGKSCLDARNCSLKMAGVLLNWQSRRGIEATQRPHAA